MSILTSSSTHDDYVPFISGVTRIAKLDLAQYKRGQMERRIRTFATQEGHPDLADYLAVLRRDPEALDRFLDRITINVSQLFRNPEQWTALAKKILPDLAKERRIRAWSAGSSYGAEAYTLASVCLDAAPDTVVDIRGTDIDPRMVARAKAGVFSRDDARDAPRDALKRHFLEDGDSWRASPALLRLVRFEQGDLLKVVPRPASYDLILCRNTVIYFNEPVRDELHSRLVQALRPGGYLIVGATERVANASSLGLSSPMPFVYRKDS